ncbi:AlpA family phage regulatory protein [Granulosicoccaceae sp. 1_MG-2023]|nr:AlpA family phage regulatory protein [Granulosicoccaceae sp. 1_MG-2023]
MNPSKSKFLRIRQACELTGLCRSALYAHVSDGLVPPPVKISLRASAWPEHEIEAVNGARLRGDDDDQIRELVRRLVEARQKVTP